MIALAVCCGPLALARAARILGLRVGLRRALALVPLARDGSSLLDLSRAAVALGLQPRLLWTNAAGLRLLPKPAVVHLAHGHFDVVEACDEARVHLTGFFRARPYPWSRFEHQWSGATMTLQRCA